MKLSEAIRVAEKAKSWLDRFPEYRAAVDELIKLARTQTGEAIPPPERGISLRDRIAAEMGRAWDEFAGAFVDLPCAEDAPAPEAGQVVAITDVTNGRTGSGTIVALSPHGVNVVTVDSWDDTPAESAPAAPKPGDTVPNEDAALNLPPGTLIKGESSGVRGLVVRSAMPGLDTQVEWADMGGVEAERYPATIVDINVP